MFVAQLKTGKKPTCDDCFLQFTMELYDMVKDQLSAEFKESLTGEHLRLAAEWAWREHHVKD